MNRPDRRRSLWSEALFIALAYAGLTLLLAYPLSVHPATQVLPQGADTDLMLWIFGWDVHALTHRPWAIFDGNIYYPFPHTLAYAENLIGSALFAAPIVWITGNLVLAMNAVSLLSCILCGVGTYVLARRLGVAPRGAAIAGLIFAFAPPRFIRLGQLHLTTVQWMPFCLASLHGYLETGRKRDLQWACGLFVLQVYTSGHGAVLTAIAILLLVVWRLALGEPVQPMKRLRDLGVTGAFMLSLTMLLFLPYRAVQQEMGLRRSLSESYLFAPNVSSFLSSPSHVDQYLLSPLAGAMMLEAPKAFLFPGWLTLVLAVAGILSIRWRVDRGQPHAASGWMRLAWVVEAAFAAMLVLAVVVTLQGRVRLRYGSTVILSAGQPWRIWVQCAALAAIRFTFVRVAPFDVRGRVNRGGARLRRWSRALRADAPTFYVVLAVLSVWLALGPRFGLYRLVYGWPGFSFIRVPSRFTIITLLALALLAGWGFEWWTSRRSDRQRTAIAALLAVLLVVEFAVFPLTTITFATNVPAVDRWLATQPTPFVVAEVPVTDRLQGTYMVHSTAHWQKTVHGYSGMRPDLHTRLYDELATFPDVRSLKSLAALGVTHVVVHARFYRPAEWPGIDKSLDGFADWLRLEHSEGDDRVYALHDPSRREAIGAATPNSGSALR